MICLIVGFKLLWIIWDPGRTTASWIVTWIWLGVLAAGLVVEVVLRRRGRAQRALADATA
jgi:hypothetical protein